MPRLKKPDTREHILDAARRLFSEKGYHDTSVSDIIQAVGMAQGSFYNYFKSKNDIFKTILEAYIEDVVQNVRELDVDQIKDKTTYVAMVLRLGDALTSYFLKDEELARIFFWEAVGLNPEYDGMLDEAFREMTRYSQLYIEKGQELGVIRDEVKPDMVASATVGMCTHMLNRYLRGDFKEATRHEIVGAIFDLQLNGIINRDAIE